MPRPAVLLALVFPASSFAQNPQYRKLELTDGRQIRAEVLATEATGLRMRLPQGETLVSFEILMDMVPIDPLEYRDQSSVTVWVAPTSIDADLRRIYGAVPALVVTGPDQPGGLAPDLVTKLTACADDLDCMAEAVGDGPWMWLVTGAPPQDGSTAAMVLRGRSSGGPPVRRSEALTVEVTNLWRAAHEVIELLPPATIPRVVLAPSEVPGKDPNKPAWTLERASKLTVPRLFVPGLASFQQTDVERGVLGLGVGVLGTGVAAGVAMVAAGKNEGAKPAQAALVGVGSWVALSAFTNAWLGPASYGGGKKVGLHVLPAPEGATVGLGGQL